MNPCVSVTLAWNSLIVSILSVVLHGPQLHVSTLPAYTKGNTNATFALTYT
eukprot:m.93811 g.93811  ORF g.93811 m.93811 type:complete len:51 (-) comp13010_c1_seq10:728-880(-)